MPGVSRHGRSGAFAQVEGGYEIYMVADASGGTSVDAHKFAMDRMIQAGVVPMTWQQVMLEWQRDPSLRSASLEDVSARSLPRPDMPPEMERELEDVVRILAQNRWPWRLHATYDETISRALDAFEKVNRDIPLKGIHWFFDHAETISQRSIDRIAALGGGVAVQHRMAYQGEYFVERYGAKAAEATQPMARMLDQGLTVSAGTDATRVVYAAGPFAPLDDNPLPPPMPDWSPVGFFKGYAAWGEPQGAGRNSLSYRHMDTGTWTHGPPARQFPMPGGSSAHWAARAGLFKERPMTTDRSASRLANAIRWFFGSRAARSIAYRKFPPPGLGDSS